MKQQGADIAGLKAFATDSDREDSPIFVGREKEMAHVWTQVRNIARAYAEGRNTRGRTTVITGCPGSGKSALLKQLERETWGDEAGAPKVIVAQCNVVDLTASGTRALGARVSEMVTEHREGAGGIMGPALEDIAERLRLQRTFRYLRGQRHEKAAADTVVCLVVDEIQNIDASNAKALQLLHTQDFEPPILPVYAGLNDTLEKLEGVGKISRASLKASIAMGWLEGAASREATRALFERYRVEPEGEAAQRWADVIEAQTLGFAQHLHLALQAACEVLVERGGTARACDAAEVARRARTAREQFYGAKMTGTVREHAHTVLDVVQRACGANEPLSTMQLAGWAREAMRRHDRVGREPTAEEAIALVERMRRRGILELTEDGRAGVPIPSLSAWLAGAYATRIGYTGEGVGGVLAVPYRTGGEPAQTSTRQATRPTGT